MSIYLGTPNLPPLQSIIDIIHACSEWPWLFYSPYSRIQGQSCISMLIYPFNCWILLPMAILAPYSYKYWLMNLILSNHFTLLNVSCWLIWVSYALVTRSLWSSVDVLVPPRWLYKPWPHPRPPGTPCAASAGRSVVTVVRREEGGERGRNQSCMRLGVWDRTALQRELGWPHSIKCEVLY